MQDTVCFEFNEFINDKNLSINCNLQDASIFLKKLFIKNLQFIILKNIKQLLNITKITIITNIIKLSQKF